MNLNLLKSKMSKDLILTFISQIMIMLSFFVVNKILSNSLGIDGYGQYSLVKKNSGVLSMVMLGGMGIALPRYFAYYRGLSEHNRAKFVTLASLLFMLTISILVSIAGWITYSPLEMILIGTHKDAGLYFITFLYSFSIGLSTFMYSYYRGNGDFFKYNITQIVVQALILVSCIFINNDLFNVLAIWSTLTLIYTVIVLIRIYKDIFGKLEKGNFYSDIRESIREILPYGFSRLFGDLILFSFYAIPLIFSSSIFGIRETAYFSVGIMISNMITPLFGLLGMVLLPYVSEHVANNNHRHIQTTVNKLMLVYLVLSAAISYLVSIFLDLFIEIFFNKEYLVSSQIAGVIIWTIAAQAIYLLLRNPLDAVSKIPLNAINLTLSFIAMIILFVNSKTILELSSSFLIANIILAILSVISWYIIYPKFILKTKN